MNISISLVGSLYVIGGEMADQSASSEVDVVDVSWGQTNRGPSMRHPRVGHAATSSTTSIFVFGGLYTDTKDSCEVFNPQTKQ